MLSCSNDFWIDGPINNVKELDSEAFNSLQKGVNQVFNQLELKMDSIVKEKDDLLRQHETEIAKLKKEVKRLNKANKKMNDENEELREEIEEQKKTNEKLKKEIKDEKSNLKKEKEKAVEEKLEAMDELTTLREENIALISDYSRIHEFVTSVFNQANDITGNPGPQLHFKNDTKEQESSVNI